MKNPTVARQYVNAVLRQIQKNVKIRTKKQALKDAAQEIRRDRLNQLAEAI